MTIGEKLQEIMDWNGMKQSDLIKQTDISQSMISSYCQDVREPTLDALRKLAKALGVSVWTIINGEGLPVDPNDVTEQERRMIADYRALSRKEQALVDSMIKQLHTK